MILVTGATGFLGSHLVPRLVEDGHQVRCLVRNSARAETLRPLGAQLAEGDITRPETVADAMQGVETVIHLVGIIKQARGATFASIHVQGTKNLLREDNTCDLAPMKSAFGISPTPFRVAIASSFSSPAGDKTNDSRALH